MKKQLGNALRSIKKSQRTRANRLRRLQMESLENRQLLAADLGLAYHNYLIAEDVNQDFKVTPLDALVVINAINAGGTGTLGEGEANQDGAKHFVDVSGDNVLSGIDVLRIVNRLNAEGEGDILFTYIPQITDTSGNPISQVNVGDTFRVNVQVQDTRAAGSLQGVFGASADLGINGFDLVEYDPGPLDDASFDQGVLWGPVFYSVIEGLGSPGTIGPFVGIGGGIELSGSGTPTVADGETFTLTVGGVSEVFEFNWDTSFGADTTIITINNPSDPGVEASTTSEVVAAMLEAINGSGLGVTATDNGRRVVGLPQDVEITNLPTSLGISLVTEEFINEAFVARNRTPPLQQNPPGNPGDALKFFSIDFVAREAGTATFNLNYPELSGSENLLFGDSNVIPEANIDFGGEFSIVIRPDATAPVAMDDNLSTAEDTVLTIQDSILIANDTVTSPRSLTVVSIESILGTTTGTLSGNTYTPPANVFNTNDVLRYTVEDSAGLRSTANITININPPVNDAPVAVDDVADPVLEESASNLISGLLANDSAGPLENDVDSVRIQSVGNFSNGGSATVSANGLSVSYTPLFGFVGTETFDYTIVDEGGLTSTASVSIDVEPLILPRARTDFETVTEDSSNNMLDVLANDRVNEGEAAVLLNILTGPTNGSASIDTNGTPDDLSDDTILYTPNADFFGSDVITYTMNDTLDPQGDDSVGTLTITVEGVNDPVELTNDNATGTEDTVLNIPIATLLSNDSPGVGESDSQTLTIDSVTALTAGGTVAISGDNIVFTPDADFNDNIGSFSFSYTASDDGVPSESGSATVVVNVAAVNDNPIAGADSRTAVEDTATSYTVSTLLANDTPGPATATDESTQELSITAVSTTSANGGTVSLVGGTTINYAPAADFFGDDSFTYTLSDGAGGTTTGTVNVTVSPVNDAPIAGQDSVTAFKDIPATITVESLLANDLAGPANEADQTLDIISVAATGSTNGTVVLNADGTITYTPNADYVGPATFTYQLQDSGDGTNTSTGTVNVNVREFQPSNVFGTVFVDETRDGIINEAERRLGGVRVTLTGVSLGQTVTPQTVMTLSDGSYSFDTLGPGEYVVSVEAAEYMRDGMDIAGTLGDLDTIENQFTIEIAAPGGFDASGYNFAFEGVELNHARTLDQLASSYIFRNSELLYNGALFALNADNSLSWGALFDGYEGTQFSEAVLSADGRTLLLTLVDANNDVFTASLERGDFVIVTTIEGDRLVRVLGGADAFTWQQIDLSSPPVTGINNYLTAVDEIFEQEDWA